MKVEKRDLPCFGIRKGHVFELPFSSSFGFCGGDGASGLFRARRVAKGDRFGSELERCVHSNILLTMIWKILEMRMY